MEKLDLYLSRINFPCDLTALPARAYLVGGSVRDALLERQKTPLDLDFVLPEKAIATARDIARSYQGGFVVLDEVRQIARVVLPQGTLDFAQQEGETIETDLQRRDFTINAIAYDLQERKIIDPYQGVADLGKGILRMIAAKNLEDDPLRLLRAYRQAAQLNFTLEDNTRQTIRSLAPLLTTVAAERIQTELNYLLLASGGNKWLAAAAEDGLIQPWFSDLNQQKFSQLAAIETIINSPRTSPIQDLASDCAPRRGVQAPEMNSGDIPSTGKANRHCPDLVILAKLATLVSPQPDLAIQELEQLKYSRSYIRAVVATVKYLPQLQQMSEDISLRELYFFFLAVKDIFPILIVRAIATGVPETITTPLIERYLNPQDRVVYPQSLVTGNDLIQELKIKPSPAIGKLLTEIQIAYIEDKISSQTEAIEFARNLTHNNQFISLPEVTIKTNH